MSEISCVRCGETGQPLAAPPFPNELGTRLHDSVCQECWTLWLREQTAIINHFGLNLRDSEARQFLTQKTKEFFFGAEQP
jgi:Fe-S cluster biosynthesis and repair protein YggX